MSVGGCQEIGVEKNSGGPPKAASRPKWPVSRSSGV